LKQTLFGETNLKGDGSHAYGFSVSRSVGSVVTLERNSNAAVGQASFEDVLV
jgi:hypothetical protein